MNNRTGFTLIDILLVITICAILIGITLLVINPGNTALTGSDIRKSADINAIFNAVQQYAIDSQGLLPENIPQNLTEICRTGSTCNEDLVDLSFLTENERYLVSVPIEPDHDNLIGAGYRIGRLLSGEVTITDSLGAISVTR